MYIFPTHIPIYVVWITCAFADIVTSSALFHVILEELILTFDILEICSQLGTYYHSMILATIENGTLVLFVSTPYIYHSPTDCFYALVAYDSITGLFCNNSVAQKE